MCENCAQPASFSPQFGAIISQACAGISRMRRARIKSRCPVRMRPHFTRQGGRNLADLHALALMIARVGIGNPPRADCASSILSRLEKFH